MNNNEFGLIKSAWGPYAMNPDNTGPKPISFLSGGTSPKPVLPSKSPAQFNLNIRDLSLANKFPHTSFTQTPKYFRPTTNTDTRLPWWKRLILGGNLLPLPAPKYTSLSQFIQLYPPTPAGIPFRLVNPVYDTQGGIIGNLNLYTELLNDSRSYPEKLSTIDPYTNNTLSEDIAPGLPIYLVDGRDAANWLWNRRGLLFTDELWDNAAKAREDVTSQLGKLPQTVYYAWSNNDDVNGYSMPLHYDRDENNLYINVFNPNYFDLPYDWDIYNGYGLALYDNLLLDPWQRFLKFLDTQDHELSHSFNKVPSTLESYDRQWVWDWFDSGYKDHMFFRKTNDPENPYYDDATTSQRVLNFLDLFKDTYLELPSEYVGAMARVKRYGAEFKQDTTNTDPIKARSAMEQTLRAIANHPDPNSLTPEQQRIHRWLRTAAMNHKEKYSDNPDKVLVSEYLNDPNTTFYKDVLDFMTNATIQGLVRNDTPSNNATALQNLRYGYA